MRLAPQVIAEVKDTTRRWIMVEPYGPRHAARALAEGRRPLETLTAATVSDLGLAQSTAPEVAHIIRTTARDLLARLDAESSE